MSNGLTRGVPAQELPENQAPEVAFVLDEQTGAVTPREVGTFVEPEAKPKRRGRKKVEDAVVEEAAEVESALPRELGS